MVGSLLDLRSRRRKEPGKAQRDHRRARLRSTSSLGRIRNETPPVARLVSFPRLPEQQILMSSENGPSVR
jgi:hypothetical protein